MNDCSKKWFKTDWAFIHLNINEHKIEMCFRSSTMYDYDSMAVVIKTLKLTEYSPLAATPNASEIMILQEDLSKFPPTKKELVGEGPLQIVTTHRGYNLYLENGAVVYRYQGESVNGYMCSPKGPEKCHVSYNGLCFDADVEFHPGDNPKR